MIWTKEVPQKPGFYWWRSYDDEPWEVVELRIAGDRLFHVRCGRTAEIDSSKGEWAGPLEEPKEQP